MKAAILVLLLTASVFANAKTLCTTSGPRRHEAAEVIRDLTRNGQLFSELATLSEDRGHTLRLTAENKDTILRELLVNLDFDEISSHFFSRFEEQGKYRLELDCLGHWRMY